MGLVLPVGHMASFCTIIKKEDLGFPVKYFDIANFYNKPVVFKIFDSTFLCPITWFSYLSMFVYKQFLK